jgi:putative transcriptional regulator
MSIKINLDVVMAQRKVGVNELAERVGITPANLSILKNNRAKAIRFTTLDEICKALQCTPGDLIEYEE